MSLAFDSMLLLITTVECVVNDNNGIRLTYPHGMCTTHADVINSDLLAFIRS
jgi:non-heme chloroperoxidase